MEMERPFDYMKEGYVAKELLRVPALALLLNVSYTAQLVYALLYTKVVTERHVDGEGHCYVEMTVAQMAKHLIELEPPIRSALRELEEMEVVEIVRQGPGKANRIYPLTVRKVNKEAVV